MFYKKGGFTLIELLIVIGIIAILASGVIVAINPGQQFAQARDATRESHLNTLHKSLVSYQVDNKGNLSGLSLPATPTEICNTNLESPTCTDLVDLSTLTADDYINSLPVDPQGSVSTTSDGTGYFIAGDDIALVAEKAETRFVSNGMSELEYTCGDDVTFTYNGSSVTYGTLFYDGGCWMDRNLGASQVATAFNDSASYGDLFQWGRPDDGHQIRTSGETATLATSDHPGHSNFITTTDAPNDWRNPQNDSMWNTDGSGTNDEETCPQGWRVPTETEWSSASSGWADQTDAFNSVLKLPSTGFRYKSGSIYYDDGSYGYYWSSSVDIEGARYLSFDSSSIGLYSFVRSNGQAVRCIKN